MAGKRGQGKTTLLRAYLEHTEPRVLILDPFEDFASVRRRVDWREAVDELAEGSACRRRIVPPIGGESRDFAEELFNRLIDQRVGNLLLVMDELTLWSSPAGSEALQTLVLQGRRLGIRIVAAIQRLSLTPGVLLSEVTELVLFKMTRPRDLVVAGEWSDDETAEIVPKLGVGECFVIVP